MACLFLVAPTAAAQPQHNSPNGAQIVAGWMGSVLVGFVAWRAFDEPAGRHSRVRDDWGYTPRANTALAIGSYVGATLGVWLKGRASGADGTLLGTAIAVAIPTVPTLLMQNDPLLPLTTVIAWAPLQGFVGYMGYRVSARGIASEDTGMVAEQPTAKPRPSGDVLLAAEIARTTALNVYDAVRQLRPQWLATARMRSPTEREGGGEVGLLVAYFEGSRFGTVEALRELPITGVEEVRYYDARAATNRFGTGHSAGALVISLVKQR